MSKSVIIITTADGLASISSDPAPMNIISSSGQILTAIVSRSPAGTIAIAPGAAVVTALKITSDVQSGGSISPGDVISIAGNIVGIVGAVGVVTVGGAVVVTAGVLGLGLTIAGALANSYSSGQWPGLIEEVRRALWPQYSLERQLIDEWTNRNWQGLRRPGARNPLAIDLDGDGIETLGIPTNGSPTLFDHDGDGVRTGTGWLRPDDAWLVRDLNGNGTIDSGHELFGVDTDIPVMDYFRKARNGFEALRALDSNNDGTFNASDTAWAQVRLWQDANGDGISQAAELSTLAAKNIIGIALNETPTNVNLGNGNTVTGTAMVQLGNGTSTTAAGVDLSASNLDLASNPFYRQFPPIPLTDAAKVSPEMGGSGWARDLREAMSLGGSGASALQAAVDGTVQPLAVHITGGVVTPAHGLLVVVPTGRGGGPSVDRLQRRWLHSIGPSFDAQHAEVSVHPERGGAGDRTQRQCRRGVVRKARRRLQGPVGVGAARHLGQRQGSDVAAGNEFGC